jgi:hypothetical protein
MGHARFETGRRHHRRDRRAAAHEPAPADFLQRGAVFFARHVLETLTYLKHGFSILLDLGYRFIRAHARMPGNRASPGDAAGIQACVVNIDTSGLGNVAPHAVRTRHAESPANAVRASTPMAGPTPRAHQNRLVASTAFETMITVP